MQESAVTSDMLSILSLTKKVEKSSSLQQFHLSSMLMFTETDNSMYIEPRLDWEKDRYIHEAL